MSVNELLIQRNMTKYRLCKEICKNYNDIRAAKLQRLVYPSSVLLLCKTLKSDAPKEECYRMAIPEFLRFNIVESEV